MTFAIRDLHLREARTCDQGWKPTAIIDGCRIAAPFHPRWVGAKVGNRVDRGVGQRRGAACVRGKVRHPVEIKAHLNADLCATSEHGDAGRDMAGDAPRDAPGWVDIEDRVVWTIIAQV